MMNETDRDTVEVLAPSKERTEKVLAQAKAFVARVKEHLESCGIEPDPTRQV